MIRAIFFDFDGTISDAKRIAYVSFVRTLKELGYEFNDGRLICGWVARVKLGGLTDVGGSALLGGWRLEGVVRRC
ncbi:MAG: hypothetical protein KJ592_04870 [Nanoarchaeota archaeon]|nr:hypothetical protein [Nanoarchaeota archaeon]